jgi:cell division protein FtsL
MLVLIVGMQVEVLKLGTSIGQATAQAAALQSRDALLRADVAELSAPGRIERIATSLGMVMPGPVQIKFLTVRGGSVQQALASIRQPDRQAFLQNLAILEHTQAAQDSLDMATGVG